MENRIRVIEDALNKCLKCDYYKRELCGIYFKHDIPVWTEDHWYMASDEERDERIGMTKRWKCLEASIDEDTETGQKYYWPEDSKTRLRLLARCRVVLNQIPENELFKKEFGEEIYTAIYDLIGKMDFKALEDGDDLLDEIHMVGLEYDRESILYPRYTEGLVKYYVNLLQSEVQDKPADNTTENEVIQSAVKIGAYNISHSTPLDRFHQSFAGQPAKDLIEYILIKNNFQQIILDSWRSNKELYDDDIDIDIYYYRNFCFDYWKELREEISKGIGERVNNQAAMKKYVYSLLRPFSYISRYLYAREKDSCMYKEASEFLYEFAFYDNPRFDSYKVKKERLIDKINRGEFLASEIPAIELINLDTFKVITRKEGDMYFHLKKLDDNTFLEYLYRGLHQFAFLIEGLLLENGHDKSLLDYQKECGVILVDKIDAVDIASACGWTIEYAFSLFEGGTNNDTVVKPSGEVDMSSAHIDPIHENNNTQFTSVSIIENLSLYPGLEHYLQALQKEGFLDAQYVWIKKGHTNYHAGWAAKIMITQIRGLTYDQISELIKVKNLADNASKCQSYNKVDKMRAINQCFTKYGLTV